MRLSTVPFDQELCCAPYIDVFHFTHDSGRITGGNTEVAARAALLISTCLNQCVCLQALQIVLRRKSPADGARPRPAAVLRSAIDG
jgi:hypothetical protein